VLAIRAATGDDLPAVVELWNIDGGPTRYAPRLAHARVLLRRDPESLLVAELDGVLIGSLVAGWDGWRFHLYRLAVASAHRRAGVASALIAAAIERAGALGAVGVDAMVHAGNVGAERFWASAGFECGTEDRRWSKAL
jgi:ribosomal protein S18 acetylase RimI-like enzyme